MIKLIKESIKTIKTKKD